MKRLSLLLLAGVLFFLTLLTCSSQKNQPAMIEYKGDPYEKEWAEIDSLENDGLLRSALEKTEVLYDRAQADDNPAQMVKSLLYQGKYVTQLEEDGMVKAIQRLEDRREAAGFPVKPLLESILAETYMHYLDRHSWRINQRTALSGEQPEDIRVWTSEQFVRRAHELFDASLDHDSLQRVPLDEFEALLVNNDYTPGLRPTLYDFLGHRALDFYRNERAYLTEPAYKFYIDQPEALAPVREFTKAKFEARQENSPQFKALLLFQELLRFHLNDEDLKALVFTDLKRLEYVHEKGIMGEKDELYLKALNRLEDKYKESPSSAAATYYRAKYYADRADSYQPNPEEVGKWDYKTAKEICEAVIEKHPDSWGAGHCKGLLAQIEQKEVNFRTEEVNLPEQPFRLLLEHRNLEKAYLRVAPVDPKMQEKMGRMSRNELVDYLRGLKPVKAWSVELPQEGDYHRHSVELPVEGLPLGLYTILLCDDDSFDEKGHPFAYAFTHISRFAYWVRDNRSDDFEMYVTDRESGEPLQGVKAEFLERNYNSLIRLNEWKKLGQAESDKDGYIRSRVQADRYFRVRLSKGKDVLNLDDGFYSYSHRYRREASQHTHFFLDRAIYRPGQTIYFKCLLVEKDPEGMPRILPKRTVDITLYDANRQEVETLKLRSNEYGTVHGSFQAPRSGLTGRMRLQSSVGSGGQSFRVEEYKRPKFEVKMDPVEGSFKLDEEVTVTGKAAAYAGNVINDAQVQYRVVRRTRFPYWRGWFFRPSWTSEEMEIASGLSTTDEEGKFSVSFTAIPDRSIAEDKLPLFNYRVEVDVTDLGGETRSDQTNVQVGYTAVNLELAVPARIDKDSFQNIEVTSQNWNGQDVATKGKLRIIALQQPDRYLRDRYWSAPDQHLLSEAEHRKLFPQDPYREEQKIENWPEENTVWTGEFDTGSDTPLAFPELNWRTGGYKIVATAEDAFGADLEVVKYLQLYDRSKDQLPYGDLLFHESADKKYEPGQTVQDLLGSSLKNTRVLLEVEEDQEIVRREWIKLNNLEELAFEVEEKHRGNFHYHFYAILHGRAAETSRSIQVPWSNKQLQIEYETFRDKLYPGQKEEWRLKISGPQRDAAAAEMLAGMYDASLDAFVMHNWSLNLYPGSWSRQGMRSRGFGTNGAQLLGYDFNPRPPQTPRLIYPQLNWFGFYGSSLEVFEQRMYMSVTRNAEMDGMTMEAAPAMAEGAPAPRSAKSADSVKNEQPEMEEEADEGQGPAEVTDPPPPPVRTNLKETVFFFPELKTDEEGNIIISFTMNEALTRWKFLGLAHTKDLKYGLTSKEVVTQKDLMVQPNPPRFMREGDEIVFSGKVANLSEETLEGTARLQLFNATTMEPVDQLFGLEEAQVKFTVEAGQSAPLRWRLRVPGVEQVPALTHRVTAQAGNFTDGEESALPILTNRMLVTETLPLPVRGKEKKTFTFTRMEEAGKSPTLTHHRYSLEFTSNPAWYAVQALPYLMEFPYECSEQIFNRFYANSLAASVANAHPRVRQVFEQWREMPEDQGASALMSALEKNQDLKTALLAETPWVLQAKSEARQKRNIALLFDLNRMADEQQRAMTQLQERQLSNGGFSWFPGGRDNWYITQYFVEGIGHLDRLGVRYLQEDPTAKRMTEKALQYIDAKIVDHYEDLERNVEKGYTKMEDDNLDHIAIHYLYTRSFHTDSPGGKLEQVRNYYLQQADKYWNKKNEYAQGMLALALHRYERSETPQKIMRSLQERSLYDEELGRYWKYGRGYRWHQMPIETHALMIEAFDEVAQDAQTVEELKIWLLKNKQTNHWKTTKATAAATYALLMRGDNWLLEDEPVEIKVGGERIDDKVSQKEAGTGYFRLNWDGSEIEDDMAEIKVKNPNSTIAWGAAYWQYFEQLDKITSFEETPLQLKKQVFKTVNSPTGPKLQALSGGEKLQPGDKLTVRIELRVDRSMEYVHMKDMRAGGFEPLNVLSHYRWKGGLGYYESTRDASTNFFFSWLPKGTHVFEYPLRVVHEGDFSNGITTIQCMYAPEFTSHSEGIRVKVGGGQ